MRAAGGAAADGGRRGYDGGAALPPRDRRELAG